LVDQTLEDCLHDAMDSEGWLALLRRMEAGQIRLVARDLPAPSPLAMEILNARPYAFLDDAPLEERRTQAVLGRRWSDPAAGDDLGALDADAIAAVSEEAWPSVRNADEMHEALTGLAAIGQAEAAAREGWPGWLATLADGGRATRMAIGDGAIVWVAVERLACLQAVYPRAPTEPALTIPDSCRGEWTADEALVELLRARLTGFGPQSLAAIIAPLALSASTAAIGLARLESDGYVMRGRFSPGVAASGVADEEWCERHLLARIHRYTIKRLRREIEPVEKNDFMRFLFDWQHLSPDTRLQGRDALPQIIAQLEGYEAAAGAWEHELLAARIGDYSILWLDEACRAGKVVWARIGAPASAAGGPVRATPIVLLPRRQLGLWHALPPSLGDAELSARATRVQAALKRHGAMFFDELANEARLLPVELETALGELVATGLVNADSFAGLRALLLPAAKRAAQDKRRRRGAMPTMEEAGRWALLRREAAAGQGDNGADDRAAATEPAAPMAPVIAGKRPRLDPATLDHIAMTLLRRYGVVFWRLLEREAGWLPSWRELLAVFHRLEARGDIRGGRFIAGLSGEQFALPEAIPVLREVRRRPPDGTLVRLCGVDPLNLAGTLLPGEKIAAVAANRVLFRDGIAVAAVVAGKISYLDAAGDDGREVLRAALTAG